LILIGKKQIIFKIIHFKIIFVLILCTLHIILYSSVLNLNAIYNIFKDIIIYSYNNSYDRIFLCTLYNNEAEMAYIHIWRLYDYIDRFIIVTSNITHSGLPKVISFEPFEQNISQYMNKVDIVNFDNICNKNKYPKVNYVWCIEKSQRDYAKFFIEKNYNPSENDLLIVVDIDEILTREGIEYIRNNPPNSFKFIKGTYYFPYYYHRIRDWNKGYVVRYNKKMNSLSKYRDMNDHNYNLLKFKYNSTKSLITHCSYCFKNIDEYKNKLISFTHQEYNKPPYNTSNWIFKSHYCRRTFKDQGTDEPYEGWRHLIPDDNRLKYLIDRSFIFSLNKTSYTEKQLEFLCNKQYNRTPFETSAKYVHNE